MRARLRVRPGMWLMFALLAGMFALLAWATADLPDRGDPRAPANAHLSPEFIELTETDIVIPNIVSAILADFRSYDTLGETFVIFTAVLAVVAALQGTRRENGKGDGSEGEE